jgi:hypothetical protein
MKMVMGIGTTLAADPRRRLLGVFSRRPAGSDSPVLGSSRFIFKLSALGQVSTSEEKPPKAEVVRLRLSSQNVTWHSLFSYLV